MESTSYDVMIVDDDPAAIRLITKIVSKAGHVVRSAPDGCVAMEQIRTCCPDLVISDWEMPGMNGPALCRAIRAESLPKYVGVVLLTARSADAEMIEGLEAGADDFFSKPINPKVLVARLRAATRILEMERRLRESSQRDPLTGLFNRRTLHERLVLEWNRAARHNHRLSCVMLDLDFFKCINDTYGHVAGDAVLRAVADVLNQYCSNGVVCRYGGEEFCVVLPEKCEAEAALWAEKVRDAIAQMAVNVRGQTIRVKGSFGVAERVADATGPETLLCLADDALAVAKRVGRNRIVRQSSIDDPARAFDDDSASQAPLNQVLARDIMIPADMCPHIDDTVAFVADLLLQLRLNSAPVVDSDGHLAGIVSEIDLARAAVSGEGWCDSIRELLGGEVVTFDEESPARQVFDLLSRTSVKRVVVVRDGKPTGVISRTCFVRWLRNWYVARQHLSLNADDSTVGDATVNDSLGRSVPQQKVAQVLASVERRVGQLRERLDDDNPDFVPAVIVQATQLQELADDLLGILSTDCGIRV